MQVKAQTDGARNSLQAPPIAPEADGRTGLDRGLSFDRGAIRGHVGLLHRLAGDANVDGILILACYGEDPQTGRKVGSTVEHFAIGDVDGMTDAVMREEGREHFNVYIPWHIMRRGLDPHERG